MEHLVGRPDALGRLLEAFSTCFEANAARGQLIIKCFLHLVLVCRNIRAKHGLETVRAADVNAGTEGVGV